MDLTVFPETSNLALAELGVPYRLSLAEFENLPVPVEVLNRRETIYRFEEEMFKQPDALVGEQLEQDGYVLTHRFTKGIYQRELTIPEGHTVVGKRHAQEHIVMIIKGSCLVATERGVEYLVAPTTFISPAGEKRVVVALEECTWVCVHRTDATTLEEVEQELIIAEPNRTQRLLKGEN